MIQFGQDFNWKQLIVIGIILVGAFVFSKIVRWLIDRSFTVTSEKLKVDKTRYRFFKNAVSFVIWTIALATIIYTIPRFKHLAITLFAGAGIMLAAIGFAAQQAFSNIISGIFIVIFRPYRVGDLIKVGTQEYGIVEDITLRHTVLKNFESKRIIIPNSTMGSEVIINDSIMENKVCRFIEVGISYDSDIELACKILQEEAKKSKYYFDNRTAKEKKEGLDPVQVRVLKFDEYSVNLRAYVWLNDPLNAQLAHSDINKGIKKRFDKEGIEIPFPYRTIVYKSDMDKANEGK